MWGSYVMYSDESVENRCHFSIWTSPSVRHGIIHVNFSSTSFRSEKSNRKYLISSWKDFWKLTHNFQIAVQKTLKNNVAAISETIQQELYKRITLSVTSKKLTNQICNAESAKSVKEQKHSFV